MALVSKNIPNLINGVSQQPAALRLESQGEVQENGFSDVVDGLKKRPPTKFKKKLLNGNSDVLQNLDTAFFHTYKRSDTEQFQIVITDNPDGTTNKKIYVYDIEGTLRYENGVGSYDKDGAFIADSHNTDDTSYIPDDLKDLTATSVADATFLVNKKKVVSMSDTIDPEKGSDSALVYLKSVNYGRDYKLTLKSKTDGGATSYVGTAQTVNSEASTADDANNEDVLKVSTTVESLRNTLITDRDTEGGTVVTRIQEDADGDPITHTYGSRVESFSEHIYLNNYEYVVPSALTLPSAFQSVATDRIFITVGANVIPYDSDGSAGWYKDGNNLRLPRSAMTFTGSYYDGADTGATTYYFDRPETTLHLLVQGQSVDFTLVPTNHDSQPFFIINSNGEGNLQDFSIEATDDDGGVNLKAFKGTAKSFTDLPNQCINGYRLGVIGDNQKKEDDFHVVFEGAAGSGFWRETVAGGLQNTFDTSTMPHTLRQLDDGSFKFSPAEDVDGNVWASRKAGDDNTNPNPSFVGQTINDIFFHRNRLGVLAGENVIFSEAGGYLNFWRTTVRTLLDSDPIDVAVSQNEVSELKAAVPIQDNLLLFSDLNQFTLSAAQLLTPAEVTIDQSTKYECDLTATPVGAGTSVFFTTKSGNFSGVREFFTKTDTEIKDAPEITSHVPKYIQGQITDIKASSNEDMLVALTDADKTECYIYKWYNSSEERLQSSWSKWKFSKNIASVYFNNADLYFTFEDGSYEFMDLAQLDNPVFLDHQVEKTNFGQGYAPTGGIAISEEGYDLGAYSDTNDTVMNYLDGTKSITVGVPYTFKYQMSEQVFKPVQGDSTKLARFQLRKMSFNFSNTGKFDVTVDSLGRDLSVATFTGRILGEPDNILGQAAVVPEGSFAVGVQSKPATTKITITNDTHLPSVFQSAEWEGFVVLRNQRL